MELNLALEDERWVEALPDFEELARGALLALGRRLAVTPTELGLTLASDAAVRTLNAEWRNKDKPTNVLSFPARDLTPGEAPDALLGDLVLALETCRREAAAEAKSLADHFRHLVVHGTLHCLGYDHEDDAAADEMEALEVLILGDLGIADPYRDMENHEEPVRA
ncbi:rRNA maturation RNase YbeY [Aureimonas leprariae]|uniref:Endoribonuclease YbeY n=1 Tax=Plantimonas leprariae TaxID=2615207 RepID=A0A7V7TYB0_9HYPH|nr:rRNA maturation RNase YbeY [Aureimonas leprariae]